MLTRGGIEWDHYQNVDANWGKRVVQLAPKNCLRINVNQLPAGAENQVAVDEKRNNKETIWNF